jgi:hypothetical protein
VPGFTIRRVDRRLRLEPHGCCNPASHRREYERAYLEQVLREGGRVVSRDGGRVELIDRKGRPRSVDLT